MIRKASITVLTVALVATCIIALRGQWSAPGGGSRLQLLAFAPNDYSWFEVSLMNGTVLAVHRGCDAPQMVKALRHSAGYDKERLLEHPPHHQSGPLPSVFGCAWSVPHPWLMPGRPRLPSTYSTSSYSFVRFSVWVPIAVFAVYPAIAFVRGPLRRYRRRRRGLCITCGYNLTGNESGVCPECATEISQA